MADDDWTMEVTKLLLEEFEGRATFGLVKRSLYQRNLAIRQLSYSNRFLVFRKNEQVKYVSVALPDAGICLPEYRKRGWGTCRKDNCCKFHVCKSFISGSCSRGSRCRFGHDLENEANRRVSDSLGLSSFSAEQIRTIIFRSHPAVCVKYNTRGCEDDDCPDLHICSRFILQRCTAGAGSILGHSRGDSCRFGHTIQNSGEHNSYVLKAFGMDTCQEQVLRKLVIVSKREHPEPPRCLPAVHQQLYTRQPGRNEHTRHLTNSVGVEDTDPGADEYLCEIYTWTGVCPKTPKCPRYHSPDRLPYLWLTRNQEDGQWRRVHSSVNTDFEKSFCCLDYVRSFQFNVPGVQNVDFRAMSAKVDGVRQSVKLRRLSAPSYVTAAPGTPLSFYTQWVWYWQEHDGSYTPFYPGTLQYTLEEKYLKGQQKYYFEFEELRLMVNTQSSSMVLTNLDTQRTTSVIRRPVFITANTSGAPRMSSLLLSKVPTSVLHQVPDHWSAVDHFQDFELVELSEAAAEYIAVQRQFFSTMNRRMHKTVHIFRVQNPGLWDKYCSARRAMTPRGQKPGEVEERQLFHGTPTLRAARGICANGFDFRRSGENAGTVWGKGAYFSTTAKYSHSYTRVHTPVTGDPLRFMFLGKVLVGQYTLGDPSYAKPPERDRLRLYDSCVDNVFNPTIFVIFDLAQSYPEYLIQYTSFSVEPEKMVRTQSLPRSQASGTSLSRRTTGAEHRHSTTCYMEHRPHSHLSTASRPLIRTSTSSSAQSAKPLPLTSSSTSSSAQSAKPLPLTSSSTSSSPQSDLSTGSLSLIITSITSSSSSSSSQSSIQCQSVSSDEPFKSACLIT